MEKNLRHELEAIAALQNPTIPYLKASRLPLVLWGAAEGTRILKSVLDAYNIAIDAVVVDTPFYRPGQFFSDIPVSCWEDARKKYTRVNILVTFTSGDVLKKKAELRALPEVEQCLSMEYSLSFRFTPDFIAQQHATLEALFYRLSDDWSRHVLLAYLRARNLPDADGLAQWNVPDEAQYFPDFLLPWTNTEVYVDCGAFDGDTVARFCEQTQGNYEKIYAFECDPHNAVELRENVSRLRKKHTGGGILLFEKGVFSSPGHLAFSAKANGSSCIDRLGGTRIEVDSIDHVAQGEKVSFIKMDIEGAELEALKGAQETIRRHRPRLAICVYHRKEDLVTIPQYILSLHEDYRLYLRHYGSLCTETVLYAV